MPARSMAMCSMKTVPASVKAGAAAASCATSEASVPHPPGIFLYSPAGGGKEPLQQKLQTLDDPAGQAVAGHVGLDDGRRTSSSTSGGSTMADHPAGDASTDSSSVASEEEAPSAYSGAAPLPFAQPADRSATRSDGGEAFGAARLDDIGRPTASKARPTRRSRRRAGVPSAASAPSATRAMLRALGDRVMGQVVLQREERDARFFEFPEASPARLPPSTPHLAGSATRATEDLFQWPISAACAKAPLRQPQRSDRPLGGDLDLVPATVQLVGLPGSLPVLDALDLSRSSSFDPRTPLKKTVSAFLLAEPEYTVLPLARWADASGREGGVQQSDWLCVLRREL